MIILKHSDYLRYTLLQAELDNMSMVKVKLYHIGYATATPTRLETSLQDIMNGEGEYETDKLRDLVQVISIMDCWYAIVKEYDKPDQNRSVHEPMGL